MYFFSEEKRAGVPQGCCIFGAHPTRFLRAPNEEVLWPVWSCHKSANEPEQKGAVLYVSNHVDGRELIDGRWVWKGLGMIIDNDN